MIFFVVVWSSCNLKLLLELQYYFFVRILNWRWQVCLGRENDIVVVVKGWVGWLVARTIFIDAAELARAIRISVSDGCIFPWVTHLYAFRSVFCLANGASGSCKYLVLLELVIWWLRRSGWNNSHLLCILEVKVTVEKFFLRTSCLHITCVFVTKSSQTVFNESYLSLLLVVLGNGSLWVWGVLDWKVVG